MLVGSWPRGGQRHLDHMHAIVTGGAVKIARVARPFVRRRATGKAGSVRRPDERHDMPLV